MYQQGELIMKALLVVSAIILLSACSVNNTALPSIKEGMGNNPQLPAPKLEKMPTVSIAKAVGWDENTMPTVPAGFNINAFAKGLDHPRWLYTLPNGDVLVAETNGPANPDAGFSIRGWFAQKLMKKAGAGVKSPDRITLLRDADKDGVAELKTVFAENLNSPFGMALVDNTLYIANADALVKYDYVPEMTRVNDPFTKVIDLPAGINHHWTKNVIAAKNGKLLVTVGSNSNVGENGMQMEENRAAILEIDPVLKASRVFASGLRNPNGMVIEPQTGALWTVVNERDQLGGDLVPDYLTSVKEGGFYGWPYYYYGQHIDPRIKSPDPARIQESIKPDYALGSHTASLGLLNGSDTQLGERFAEGMFIAQHGSWNRSPKSGYKVIYVPFKNGIPNGDSIDVVTGFLNSDEEAQGRPVGLEHDQTGALLIADDVGNTIWRVSKK
jgi:glucose/arabinose dehydrogenase